MQYKLKNPVLNSRRGKYQLVTLERNPVIWKPYQLDMSIERHADVQAEVLFALEGRLLLHRYWHDEPLWWVMEYQHFYTEVFTLGWLNEDEDRHNIVINKFCCLTLIQYHNHRLIAYSRSTDMRNGYYSDKLILNYLAQHINTLRPDCKVEEIEWYMATPHVYKEKGIARLRKDEETT